MITAEQFAEWKTHPVTKEIFIDLQTIRDGLLESLGDGQTVAQRSDVTHGLTSKMVGHIKGLNQLLNVHYDTTDESNDLSATTGH